MTSLDYSISRPRPSGGDVTQTEASRIVRGHSYDFVKTVSSLDDKLLREIKDYASSQTQRHPEYEPIRDIASTVREGRERGLASDVISTDVSKHATKLAKMKLPKK